MISNTDMQKYLRKLTTMQRELFKAGNGYMDVNTYVTNIQGKRLNSVSAWATLVGETGIKKSFRIDLLSTQTTKETENEINKLTNFLKN